MDHHILFGGVNLDSSGTYVDTLISTFGCDSIVTLNLVVHPIYDVTLNEQICEGTVYDFNGNPLDSTGTYVANLTTINGCDSIVTLNLTVLDILRTDLTDSICDGESLDFNGQILTTSGTYTHTSTSSIGCDSVIMMELTVLPINTETYNDAICEGDTYDFNGNIISSAGTYIDTVPGSNGCDSIVTLILTVNPIERTNLTAEICDDVAYEFGALLLDATGIYVDTLSTIHGCDSIVTLDLTVHPTYDITLDEQICNGTSFDFNGDMLTTTGVYTQTLSTSFGCDSVVTINLTVLEILRTDLTDSICYGESLDFNGQILTTSGTYTHTTTSSIGCDSVITMVLTVLTINTETHSDAICEGDTYDFNGNIISSAGTYVDTVPGSNGCDSIVTLILTVNPIERTNLTEEICDDVAYEFGALLLDATGIYVDTLSTIHGCDSIVTLDLTVHPTMILHWMNKSVMVPALTLMETCSQQPESTLKH